MVNTEDFIKRLEIILEFYSLNASSFADQIGVQRSSLSHLLSGRNKPSLDFILKIIEVYPDVDLYWILNGKGTFPSTVTMQTNALNTLSRTNTSTLPITSELPDLFSTVQNTSPKETKIEKETFEITPKELVSIEVDKIVFFYKNGTFKIYNPDTTTN
jgi:transcriptional regulator with XRE-family HTH domain